MLYILYAIVVVGCATVVRNTTLMEIHTRELLDKAKKFDELYEKIKTISHALT